jgi:hypothetical protein
MGIGTVERGKPMKGIVLTTDEKMLVKDFAEPLYKSLGEQVGGFIEVVRPRGLDKPYCFVCNEEGIRMDLPLNIMGSLWYGTLEHGHPIVGNIVVLKQGMTDDGHDIVGLEEDDIRKIKQIVDDTSGGRILDLDEEEIGNA